MSTIFGSLIQVPDGLKGDEPLHRRLLVAGNLALQLIRDDYTFTNPHPLKLLQTDYPILLNVNSDIPGRGGIKFATNQAEYKAKVKSMLDSLPKLPELLVCENEANNTAYYNDTPENYMRELKWLIQVGKEYNIPVTDSGSTWPPLVYLYAQSLPPDEGKKVLQRNKINVGKVADNSKFVDYVLTKIRYTSAFACNFHYYYKTGDDLNDLENIIKFIRTRSGKPVMTNEIGMLSGNPNIPAQMVKIAKRNSMPYFSFYSDKDNSKTEPLQDANGNATVYGVSYCSALIQ